MSLEFIGIINVIVFTGLLYAVPLALFILWLAPRLSKRISADSKYSVVLTIAGVLTVAVTWYVLFWFILLSTERTLVPWHVFDLQAPPANTWERQLNDFFNGPPGSVLPAILVLGASAWLFVARLRRTIDYAGQFRLFLLFAATNLVFMLVSFVLIVPLRDLPNLWLPQPRPPIDVGYQRTWVDLLGTTVLILLLLLAQAKGTKLQRAERSDS
jgi:hypothetical protein